MTYAWHLALSAAILGTAAWGSNIWPGIETWWRAALSRVIWWGAPFAAIALVNDAPWGHAACLGAAAWCGAWLPHSAMVDVRTHWAAMLSDLAMSVLRAVVLLALPAGVFWLCGTYWLAMIAAAGGVVPSILAGSLLPHRWRGLATERQVAGVVFGASVGFWVAAAILIPDALPDRLQ